MCDCNRKSCGVSVDIDNVDHVPLNAIKLEETVTHECHVQSFVTAGSSRESTERHQGPDHREHHFLTVSAS